jgi:hypothetical protein
VERKRDRRCCSLSIHIEAFSRDGFSSGTGVAQVRGYREEMLSDFPFVLDSYYLGKLQLI